MRCWATILFRLSRSEYNCVKLYSWKASSEGHRSVHPAELNLSWAHGEPSGGAVPFKIHSKPALLTRVAIVLPLAALTNFSSVSVTDLGIRISDSSWITPVCVSKLRGYSSACKPAQPPLELTKDVPLASRSNLTSVPSNVANVRWEPFWSESEYSTVLSAWWKMTFSRSSFDEDARRCALTNSPRRWNALFLGIKREVLGDSRSLRACDVENTAAKKEERSKKGKTVSSASDGGTSGREMK